MAFSWSFPKKIILYTVYINGPINQTGIFQYFYLPHLSLSQILFEQFSTFSHHFHSAILFSLFTYVSLTSLSLALSGSVLPHSLPSGLACSFLSISTLGKTREGKDEKEWVQGLGACRQSSREVTGEARGKSEERGQQRSGDLTLLNAWALTNGCLMTRD